MLEAEELDLLWVCTPPLHHRGPAVAALAAGVHVYLEKPIARTLEDAAAIVDAAGSAAGVCAVGYQWHAERAARGGPGGARRPAGRDAGGPQLRTGGGPAVVRRPGAGGWPDPGAGEPPHRPAAGARGRDRRRRGVRGGRSPLRVWGSAPSTTRSHSCCISRAARSGTIHSVWSADGQPGALFARCARREGDDRARPRPRRPSDQRRLQRSGDRRRMCGIRWSGRSPVSWTRRDGATGRWSPARPTTLGAPWPSPWPASALWRTGRGSRRDSAADRSEAARRAVAARRRRSPPARSCRRDRRPPGPAPLVAVTYSVEPAKTQLVACSPRSISSRTSPSRREDGHPVGDRRADEQRVRPRQTPCRRARGRH